MKFRIAAIISFLAIIYLISGCTTESKQEVVNMEGQKLEYEVVKMAIYILYVPSDVDLGRCLQ